MQEDRPLGNLAGVGLHRLRYFVAVAEECNFGRASERLHIAQPALSRQIAELEAALGCGLFDRIRNQIKLTAAGSALLPRARDVILRVEEAVRFTRRAAQGALGVLEIGFVGSATYSVLPEVLHAFRQLKPNVDLSLFPMSTSELHQALTEGKIQAAFARPGISDPQIINERVLVEPLVVAMPTRDPLAELASLKLTDLASRPFVLYPQLAAPDYAEQIVRACESVGFTPVIAQEAVDLQTALGLIAVGIGISLVPASVERSGRHGVVYKPLKGLTPHSELSFCYRRDNLSDLLREFRKVVHECVEKGFGSQA